MAAYLVPVDPGLCVIPLEKAILLIGRQSDCDVSLTASRKISRKHCCIAIVNETVIVRDLGSTNGVTINGSRINREAQLHLGDELGIGDVRFRLQREATPSPRPQKGSPAVEPVAAPHRGEHPTPARGPVSAPVSMDFPVALVDEAAQPPALLPVASATQKTASDYDFIDQDPLVPYQPTADDFVPLRSDVF